ncbi:hypothetical protein PybrP1_012331 [[Pythium] brassicae (nom. inval.)]|nr:hypothetical protein PybrP1_012331 [[Pythium] brassicae (nom. inval.)]
MERDNAQLPLFSRHHHYSSDLDATEGLREPQASSSAASTKRELLLRAALALVSAVALLLLLALLPLKLYVLALAAWVKTHPFVGTFAVIAFFWAAIPLWVPSTVLEMVAGSLFGVAHGLAVIVVGKTGGSLLAFLAARRLGKVAIGDYLAAKFASFRALCDVLNSASWKPLLLFQLSSVPNTVKCYALAITDVSAARFAVSSAVGGMPHSMLWANIGDQASDIAAIVSGRSELSSGRLGLIVAGGAVTTVAMAALVVYTRRQLRELQKRECGSGSEEESLLLGIETLHRPDNVGKRQHSPSRTPPRWGWQLSGKLKRRLAIGVALAAATAALCWLVSAVPLHEYSTALSRWIQANKAAGSVVFPLVYWLLVPLCIPSSMFDLIGGSVFGVFYGVVLNTVGKTGGALLAFALGKKLGRERVGGYLEANFPAFSAVSAILQSESWKPLMLVQLSTLPHAVKSYGLAITDVSTYRFLVSSFVTALPFTILLTQVGSQTQELLAHASQQQPEAGASGVQAALFIAGIVLTLATMVFFVVYTKREIQRQLSRVASKQSFDAACESVVVVDMPSDGEATRETRGHSGRTPSMTEFLLPATLESSSSEGVPKQRCSIV